MDQPADFEIVAGRGYLRPTTFVSIDHAVELVDAALSFARAQKLGELLADVRGLARFPSPSVIDRFWIVSRWAETAGSRVRLAVVACQEHIDPDKFGVAVAKNRGLEGNVFATDAEAVAWLESLPKLR